MWEHTVRPAIQLVSHDPDPPSRNIPGAFAGAHAPLAGPPSLPLENSPSRDEKPHCRSSTRSAWLTRPAKSDRKHNEETAAVSRNAQRSGCGGPRQVRPAPLRWKYANYLQCFGASWPQAPGELFKSIADRNILEWAGDEPGFHRPALPRH